MATKLFDTCKAIMNTETSHGLIFFVHGEDMPEFKFCSSFQVIRYKVSMCSTAYHIDNHCFETRRLRAGRKSCEIGFRVKNIGTGIEPIQTGIEPDNRLSLRSKSASLFIFEIEFGIEPSRPFLLNKTRLNIDSFPKSTGISPERRLLLKSKCISFSRFTMDAGICPVIALSARLRTVSFLRFPISSGMVPVNRFPMRSMILRLEREVMQVGISPAMDFQSATTSVLSSERLQISGEIEPPVRRALIKILSSDSPRRLMSVTLPDVGSQLTPYQFEQQSLPVQGSEREDLKAVRAARSDGEQELTATVTAKSKEIRKRNFIFSLLSLTECCEFASGGSRGNSYYVERERMGLRLVSEGGFGFIFSFGTQVPLEEVCNYGLRMAVGSDKVGK
ncbi:LOW QUALITY PROTEIN: hypothetical protein RJ641_036662 [Dillenia turbinata]|uniref:Uncharacterized protein n=1 Tax=Dillenia turbinata TaxID=194707 RepID=A0AAN8ZH44_9MAGN